MRGLFHLAWILLFGPWLWTAALSGAGPAAGPQDRDVRSTQPVPRPSPSPSIQFPDPVKPPPQSTQLEELHQPNVLLVSLLDGSIVGVDSNTGAKLWAYDSGAPLVSVTQSDGAAGGINIFPGIDGALYAYHGLDAGKAQLERLPMSLPELVTASPSLAVDGSVVLGTRVSTVFALHRQSGQLVRLLSGVAGALSDSSTEGVQLPGQFDPSSMVLVGREDFIVRSMQAHTGQETWNATFARVMQLHPLSHPRMPPTTQPLGGDGPAPRPPGPRLATAGMRLAMAADNALQAYDARTGFRRWSIKFDAPPIAAFDTSLESDGRNHLEPGPAAPSGLQPQAPRRGQPAGGQQVMVGVLHGSLYAIPTDMIACVPGVGPFTPQVLPGRHGSAMPALPPSPNPQPQLPDISMAPEPFPGVWPGQSGSGQAYPHGTGSSSSAGSGEASTALAVVVPDATALSIMSHTPDNDTAPMVASLVCPLGMHELADGSSPNQQPSCSAPHIPWLPAPPNTSVGLPAPGTTGRGVLSWQRALALALAAVVTMGCLALAAKWLQSTKPGPRASSAAGPASESSSTTLAAVKSQGGVGSAASGPGPVLVPDAASQVVGTAREAGAPDSPRQLAARTNASNHSDNSTGGGVGKRGGKGKKGKSGAAQPQPQQDGSNNSRKGSSAGKPGGGGSAGGQGQGPEALDAGSPQEEDSLVQLMQRQASAGASDAGAPQQGQQSLSNHSVGSSLAGADPAAMTRVAQLQPDGSFVMGRLRVGPGILGYGSAGTIVYEGWLDGRPVAVKRLLRQFYDLAKKEIDVLIVSDEHPNVVRCFAMEEDREFVYLALERCRSSLADALAAPQAKSVFLDASGTGPSQRCVEVMQQVVSGLAALHERGIVHRDLKPHNVLLTEAGRVKLSDMGLSRQLVAEQSSFESHGAGGSSGWQAPEQLIARGGGAARQTRSMDVFSLGCVLYYCCTAGKHPFGETFERDAAILRGHPNLTPLAAVPEALNLVSAMLAKEADARPTMQAVCGHPMWWSAEQRLQFLVDISDRVENEDREPDQRLLSALEAHAAAALQPGGGSTFSFSFTPNWGGAVESELVANLGRYRRYDYTSLRDLLRVVRNKRNHFREMPSNLQALVGPLPHGFLKYFTSRFPNLLMAGWVFGLRHLRTEQHLAHYWPGGAHLYERFVLTFLRTHPQRQQQQSPLHALPPHPPSSPQHLATPLGTAQPPPEPPSTPPTRYQGNAWDTGSGAAAVGRSRSPVVSRSGAGGPASMSPSPAVPSSEAGSQGGMASSTGGASLAAPVGDAALPPAYGLPPAPPLLPPPRITQPVVVGYELDPAAAQADGGVGGGTGTYVREFPRRPGKQICDFYSKTGHCKFGDNCVFDHPESMAVRLTAMGLPLRPDQPICAFYTKNNECKFGPACKFHHPLLRPVLAGQSLAVSAVQAASSGQHAVVVSAVSLQVGLDGQPAAAGRGAATGGAVGTAAAQGLVSS